MPPAEPESWPVVERGRGRPLVLLHGYPLGHAIWEPQIEIFARERRAVALDLPGYGLATDQEVPDTLSGFAEAVSRTLARGLAVPAVIVGHSFGGYVALELYRQDPELFEALVLTDSRSEPDTPEAKERRLSTARRLTDPSQHLDVEATVEALLSPAHWAAGGPLTTRLRSIVRGVPSRTLVASLRAIAGRPDLTPVLPSIRVPTLVLWGEEDGLIPPEQSRAMVPRIQGAVGIGIPGAGHLPSLEAPESFGQALREFLQGLARP